MLCPVIEILTGALPVACAAPLRVEAVRSMPRVWMRRDQMGVCGRVGSGREGSNRCVGGAHADCDLACAEFRLVFGYAVP